MWLLLKTELKYQWQSVIFLIVFAILALTLTIITKKEFFGHFMPAYLALFTPYALILNGSKEKRHRSMVALPVGVRTLALYRLSLVIISLIFYRLFFSFSYSILAPHLLTSPAGYIKAGSVILIIYAASYIYLDLMRGFINRKGITKEKVTPVLLLLGIIVQVWLVLAFVKSKSGAESTFHPGYAIDWLVAHRPFQGEYGFLVALALSLFLALVSIISYQQSKTRF
jgi:hypothetical protein